MKKYFFNYWFLSLFLLGAISLLTPNKAQAAPSCAIATSPSINFGTTLTTPTVATAVSGTGTYTCTNPDGAVAYISLCVNIGTGSGAAVGSNRQMINGTSGIQFQLYQNAGNSVVFGSGTNALNPTSLPAKFTIPAAKLLGASGTYSGTFIVYGVLIANQTTPIAGVYTDTFSATDAFLSGEYSETGSYPTTCGTASFSTFAFTATATIVKNCTVTAPNINFGTVNGSIPVNINETTTLSTTCTNKTPYQIGLDNGQNYAGGLRGMIGSVHGNVITYGLYSNSGETVPWGNTVGTNTVAGTGSGIAQSNIVYSQLPTQAPPAPDAYNDTVTVSVFY